LLYINELNSNFEKEKLIMVIDLAIIDF